MELKDPSVGGSVFAGLDAAVGYIEDHDFVYLKQLDVARVTTPEGIELTVSDLDGAAPYNLVGGALVIVSRDGIEVARGTTDADGGVSLAIPAGDGALVATISKTGFSTEAHPLD